MKGRVNILLGVGAACLFLAAVLVSNNGTNISLAQGKTRSAHVIEPKPSPAERHAGGRGGGGSSLAKEAWERAAALEREASVWMARGEIKGLSSAKSSGGRPCVRMGKQSLCGVDQEGDASGDTTSDETAFGAHGTIPPEVAASWGRRFEEAGGIRVPHGSFFDGTNSEVWSGGGANKGWNPAGGGEDKSGWANPTRWVAGRKAAQRGVYQFDGVPEDAEYGDTMQSARWPYGYGASGDRGQGTPDQFLAGVSRRYNNPTESKYMDDMYHKLGAGRSSALDRMSEAVRKLDWEANMVYPRMQRELAVPVDREVAAIKDGGADGGKDFLKKVSEMRFQRHLQEMPKEMDV